MSQTYVDKTGITFHYNSDLSGGVEIVVPPNNPHGDGTSIAIEADVLSRFIFHAMMDPEETLAWLDKIREWVNQHTNAVMQYRAERALVPPYVKPKIEFGLEVGDRVFLTFSEARGETGVVTELLEQFVPVAGKHRPYVDVKLDKDGSQTGPMPVTCVQARRPEDQ